MCDIECPYCGEEQEINHDDGYGYSEDDLHQQQCGDCDKVFSYTTCISFVYEAEKAPCLNDKNFKHDFTKETHTKSWYEDEITRSCELCNYKETENLTNTAAHGARKG